MVVQANVSYSVQIDDIKAMKAMRSMSISLRIYVYFVINLVRIFRLSV